MRFDKRLFQALLAVLLGAMASAGALAQSVTTRVVTAGGSATTATIAPGGSVSIDVRMDVVTAQLTGTGFRLSQTSPAPNGFFSITGRSFVGSPFNDTASGTPDATVFAVPGNLLDPDNDENLGRTTIGLVGTPPVANMLAATLTLTASASTPPGTYTIAPTAGISFASDTLFNDYDMSTGTPFTIVVGQTLTVIKTGTGTGTVTANSGAINCGSTCSDVYPGTTVTLTAAPAVGSTFVGWSGSSCSGTGTCVVTVDAAKTVTAQFDLIPVVTFALNVTKTGTGSGTVTSNPAGINCGADCSENYAENTIVTLTAAPAASSSFGGWSGGGCSGTALTCQVTMSAAQSVQATFNVAVTLTVAKAGNGTGTVTSDVGGINCGSTCAVGYPSGTVVTLTATPGTGQDFTGWSGGGCSGTGTCVVTMTAATTVTATFTDTTPPVTTITGNPTDPSSDSAPRFTFTSSEANSTFLCSLNGATPTPCTSPTTVFVNNGAQVFTVQAIDQAGNPGNVASYSWTAAGIVFVQAIPTLSEWALIVLSLMMASMGLVAYRRRM